MTCLFALSRLCFLSNFSCYPYQGNLTADEITVSRFDGLDQKRPLDSSLNGNEAELSPNKKQAVASPNSKGNSVGILGKAKKNDAPCGFPLTVRSLTSTGIFDDVPVKYISTSGKELCGKVKGTGYLCGCDECKFSKVLNADEFERHASSKSKHPNCRIYFENGMTIYRAVQKLRRTPENKLFDKIQTATGSPINQKTFSAWKDLFQSLSHNQAGSKSEHGGSKGGVTIDRASCN